MIPVKQIRSEIMGLFWGLLLTSFSIVTVGCGESASKQQDKQEEQAQEVKVLQANVEVLQLRSRDVEIYNTFIGHLLPKERITLKSEIAGVIEKASFEEGRKVEKGELLFHISTKHLRIKRDLAHSNYKLIKMNFDRDKELAQKKLVPSSQLDLSRNKLEQSQFSLELAEIELMKSKVISPIAGRVKVKSIDVGEYANKGETLTEILDTSEMQVLFHVPEKTIRFIRPKSKVEVTIDALEEKTFGWVKSVGLEADAQNRSFPVKIALPNVNGGLRAGMLARVKILTASYADQIQVPCHAVLERDTGKVVFLAQKGLAVETLIQTGECVEANIRVLSGLTLDSAVVVSGHQQLSSGEPIRVMKQTVQEE